MKQENVKMKNPVAKNLRKFNKPKVERDRTKYTRKTKHKESRS